MIGTVAVGGLQQKALCPIGNIAHKVLNLYGSGGAGTVKHETVPDEVGQIHFAQPLSVGKKMVGGVYVGAGVNPHGKLVKVRVGFLPDGLNLFQRKQGIPRPDGNLSVESVGNIVIAHSSIPPCSEFRLGQFWSLYHSFHGLPSG